MGSNLEISALLIQGSVSLFAAYLVAKFILNLAW